MNRRTFFARLAAAATVPAVVRVADSLPGARQATDPLWTAGLRRIEFQNRLWNLDAAAPDSLRYQIVNIQEPDGS